MSSSQKYPHEEGELLMHKRYKTEGMRAFVARNNGSKLSNHDRSIVLIGSNKTGYMRGIHCRDGNHNERAKKYAEEFNNHTIQDRGWIDKCVDLTPLCVRKIKNINHCEAMNNDKSK